MTNATGLARYDRTTIVLHWCTAGLVVGLWGLAQVIDFFPSGMPRVLARSTHILLGVILGVVLALRLRWRFAGGASLPAAEAGWRGGLAKAVHVLLYVLVVGTVIGGLANTWVRGDNIFGLFKLTSFAPGDRETRALFGDIHALGANAVLITAGLHAAAALLHHYVLKDDVLRRMLPAR